MVTDLQRSSHGVKRVRASYVKMLFYGVVVTLAAVMIAWIFNKFYPLTQGYTKLLEYMGYTCWSASLGMLGWEIQTWEGSSSAERLNQKLVKLFSLVGIFLFVLARELIPKI